MLQILNRRRGEKGFTLIELLVVIAIIGVLATIVLVSLNTARQKARDTRRVSDMRQIALALEMYYADNSAYPTGSDADFEDDLNLDADLETTYITNVPTDPGGNNYVYAACNSDQQYSIGCVLEDSNNSALDDDVDTPTCGIDPDGDGANGCANPQYCIEP